MYLLDTNHCSYIIDNHPRISAEVRSRSEAHFATSIITYGELLYMVEKSTQKAENLITVQSFLNTIGLYRLDEETAIIYSRLKIAIFNQFAPKDQAKRRKARIQTLGFDDNDLWIAATALQHNLTLVSADSDFTRMQQVCPLSLESWK
ncbi:type II toxin-antitoxin system VapC family toxin [Leptolyngbya boryana CZ1]|uniref:Ribonuclease VapC n=1 Tax=Leptolyngbya boryana CZ1 TaxID=3060204 RepID=A0AA96WTA3_LEPBY|nr:MULTISPECIES: type II toxin-antitoxin system VapC family toxin [Leptolyngbya]MBN8564927.1 type II toxin-antitoxin system VapC family toxin [Leptolyngbya sp. UWPOB_LEPTO1]WNZ45152.1 type II toxin-antitoxin system VapC family toxin [Leptolyngbya boryana CZ1]